MRSGVRSGDGGSYPLSFPEALAVLSNRRIVVSGARAELSGVARLSPTKFEGARPGGVAGPSGDRRRTPRMGIPFGPRPQSQHPTEFERNERGFRKRAHGSAGSGFRERADPAGLGFRKRPRRFWGADPTRGRCAPRPPSIERGNASALALRCSPCHCSCRGRLRGGLCACPSFTVTGDRVRVVATELSHG